MLIHWNGHHHNTINVDTVCVCVCVCVIQRVVTVVWNARLRLQAATTTRLVCSADPDTCSVQEAATVSIGLRTVVFLTVSPDVKFKLCFMPKSANNVCVRCWIYAITLCPVHTRKHTWSTHLYQSGSKSARRVLQFCFKFALRLL